MGGHIGLHALGATTTTARGQSRWDIVGLSTGDPTGVRIKAYVFSRGSYRINLMVDDLVMVDRGCWGLG